MQGTPILAAEPVGLPLTEKTLADYLKELGYSTKAVGKWHLGYYKREYTPRFRGFDNFYGYYAGFISYYDHILQDVVSVYSAITRGPLLLRSILTVFILWYIITLQN